MSAFTVYKPGQGYWTRVLTAVGAGALVLAGASWLWEQFSRIHSDNRIYYQAAAAVLVIAICAAFLWWVLNKPRIVDFMIATESEMRKVNWPTWREVIGSTWVVICGTAMLAMMLWVINLLFAMLFRGIGILV